MDSYRTLAGRATATIVEKKSEFIAAAAPAATEEDALALLLEVRAAHRTARHNVYAYLLREGARRRYSDDGEPAKTAGLPVLGVLEHSGVTDCIIVVTRYFGGVLLGTGGLVRAYTAAAKAALDAAGILTVQKCVRLTLTLAYPLYEPVRKILENGGAVLAEPLFTDVVQIVATLPQGGASALLKRIAEASAGKAEATLSEPFFIPF